MRLFGPLLLLAAMPAWADGGLAETPAPDWRLDADACLYSNTRCTGTLKKIYENLLQAKEDPGADNWRLEYWERRLREYFEYEQGRHD